MADGSRRRAPFQQIIVFLIAVGALLAFIWLNRKMAPPYPKPQTNSAPVMTNTTAKTP